MSSRWLSPIAAVLVPTGDTLSFREMPEGFTGLPLPPHPGAFGVQRRNHVHEGVDLYCAQGEPVFAVEEGKVVSVAPFTGSIAGSPWWLDTWAVMVEGASGVLLYGEIVPESGLALGEDIFPGQVVGHVTRVLRNPKGRPDTMLHLELHVPGTREAFEWLNERPVSLLDPTPFLLEVASGANGDLVRAGVPQAPAGPSGVPGSPSS